MARKTDLNMDVLRAHSTHTIGRRFIVSFGALTLLCEIRRRMTSSRWTASARASRTSTSHISPIKVIYGGDECRFAEVTK